MTRIPAPRAMSTAATTSSYTASSAPSTKSTFRLPVAEDLPDPGLQVAGGHRLVVDGVDRPRGHVQDDLVARLRACGGWAARLRRRHLDIHALEQPRLDHHGEDEQAEQHVHHRRDVDVGDGAARGRAPRPGGDAGASWPATARRAAESSARPFGRLIAPTVRTPAARAASIASRTTR